MCSKSLQSTQRYTCTKREVTRHVWNTLNVVSLCPYALHHPKQHKEQTRHTNREAEDGNIYEHLPHHSPQHGNQFGAIGGLQAKKRCKTSSNRTTNKRRKETDPLKSANHNHRGRPENQWPEKQRKPGGGETEEKVGPTVVVSEQEKLHVHATTKEPSSSTLTTMISNNPSFLMRDILRCPIPSQSV